MDDFEDDGGTPMWRARHAGWRYSGRTVVVGRRRAGFWDWVVVVAFAGFVLPWLILYGGIVVLAALTALGL